LGGRGGEPAGGFFCSSPFDYHRLTALLLLRVCFCTSASTYLLLHICFCTSASAFAFAGFSETSLRIKSSIIKLHHKIHNTSLCAFASARRLLHTFVSTPPSSAYLHLRLLLLDFQVLNRILDNLDASLSKANSSSTKQLSIQSSCFAHLLLHIGIGFCLC
jgi:hypothetical protein